MIKNNTVLPALETLLEELDAIIAELNQEGEQLKEKEQTFLAQQILSKAEIILAFKEKLSALHEEWSHIDLPLTPTKLKQQTIANQASNHPIQRGLRTPNKAFHLPILRALVQLGGSGPIQTVLDRVHEMMKDQLNDFDYQSLPSNPHTIRWENNAQWARFQLVNEGYLAADSPRGVWEITAAGRKRVSDLYPDLNIGKVDGRSDYQADPFDFKDSKDL
jgi:hypothetical protein